MSRYAAEGDANGEPISVDRGQESEKMEHLEREVLQYPGYACSYFIPHSDTNVRILSGLKPARRLSARLKLGAFQELISSSLKACFIELLQPDLPQTGLQLLYATERSLILSISTLSSH